ncbi:MAG: DUF5615 family PIN-like protein [Pricia sp.]
MKFIIDAQLPKILSDYLNEKGFDSIHTLELPDANKSKDSDIIKLAEKESRIVVSKDSDFLESYLIRLKPKKLLLVTTGNIPNKKLLEIFDSNIKVITEMLSKSNLVEISQTEIIEQA